MADKNVTTKLILQGDANGMVAEMNRANTALGETGKQADLLSVAGTRLAGVFAGIGLVALGQQALDAALQVEKLQRQFTVFAGSADLGARELQFVKDTANQLGLAMLPLSESYGRFMNAVKGTANEGAAGRAAFIGISEGIAAVGMTVDEQTRAWAQLNQGIMKGKFEMEDLKTINEAGLPIFKLMADALGITTGELLKMQTEGKLLVEDVLPKLGESMHQAFGQAAVDNAKSAQAEINRLDNAMFELKGTIGSALIPAMTEATRGLTSLAKDVLPGVVGGVIAVQAEIIRVGMLIDMAGGSITSFNYAFYKTLEIATRFVTLGQFGDSFKQMAEDADRYNKMYQGRYNDKDKRLEELANTEIRLQNTMARLGSTDYNAAERARQAGNKPSAMPGKAPKNETNNWGAAHEKYLAYLEAFNAREVAIAKAGRDAVLLANEQGFASGLVSLGVYLETKNAAIKASLDEEYYAALENLDRRQQELVKASAGDPRKSEAENAKDYHDALKNVETATTSLINIESKRTIALLKGSEEAKKALYDEQISKAAALSHWAAIRERADQDELRSEYDHQNSLIQMAANTADARMSFLGQDEQALQSHYEFERQQIMAQTQWKLDNTIMEESEKRRLNEETAMRLVALDQDTAIKRANTWWNNSQQYISFAQNMTTMAMSMLFAEENQRNQIGQRMLATSVRFIAQGLQAFMFGKAKEHLLAAASAAGVTQTRTAQAAAEMGIGATMAAAWTAYFTAMSMNPYGGQAFIPAATAMAAATAGFGGAAGAVVAEGASAIAVELGMAAAWGAGGILVGALGEAGASAIENKTGTSQYGSTSSYGVGGLDYSGSMTNVVTQPIQQTQAPQINVQIRFDGSTLVDEQKLTKWAEDSLAPVLRDLNTRSVSFT